MALTKTGTDGIKDDAVTSAKIIDGAVTQNKIGNNAIVAANIADDAVADNKLSDHASNDAFRAVGTNHIKDQAVTLAKLPHGDGSNDGKFLRANNGADPTFETVNTDLVSDTSPQLGGHLDANGKTINCGDSSGSSDDRVTFGAGTDLSIYHNGTDSVLDNTTGELQIATDGVMRFQAAEYKFNNAANSEKIANFFQDGACELYNNHSKKFETTDVGVRISHTGDANLQLLADSDNNGSNNWPHVQFRVDNTSGQAEAQVVYRQDNAVLKVDILGTEKVGVNANGLVFNGDTAAANALDDYEEGTFTPTVASANGLMSMSYTNQVGSYVKIGKKVSVQGFVRGQAGGTQTNIVYLTGLPFNINERDPQCLITDTGDWSGYPSNHSSWGGYGQINQSHIVMLSVGDKNSGGIGCANWGNTTYVYYSMTYFTNS